MARALSVVHISQDSSLKKANVAFVMSWEIECLKHNYYLSAKLHTKIGKFALTCISLLFFHICCLTCHTFYSLTINIRIYWYVNLKEMEIKGLLGEFCKYCQISCVSCSFQGLPYPCKTKFPPVLHVLMGIGEYPQSTNE